jgi:hypothetical protein
MKNMTCITRTLALAVVLAVCPINVFGQSDQIPPPPPPGTPGASTVVIYNTNTVTVAPGAPSSSVSTTTSAPASPGVMPPVVPGSTVVPPPPPPPASVPAAAPGGSAPVPPPAQAPAGATTTVVSPPPPPAVTTTPTKLAIKNASEWFDGYLTWATDHPIKAMTYFVLIVVGVVTFFGLLVLLFLTLIHLGQRRRRARLAAMTTAVLFCVMFAPYISAATLTDDSRQAGVLGNNYDVVFHGTGLATASSAYFWCQGVSTNLYSVSDTELKMRITVAANAPAGQVCGLRVLGVTAVGYQDFFNKLIVGTKEQYHTAQMSAFVQHWAPLTTSAPKVVNHTVYRTDPATKQKVAALENEVRRLSQQTQSALAPSAPSAQPAPTAQQISVNTQPIIDRMEQYQSGQSRLVSRVDDHTKAINTLVAQVQDLTRSALETQSQQVELGKRQADDHETIRLMVPAVLTHSKENMCDLYINSLNRGLAKGAPPRGCKVVQQ